MSLPFNELTSEGQVRHSFSYHAQEITGCQRHLASLDQVDQPNSDGCFVNQQDHLYTATSQHIDHSTVLTARGGSSVPLLSIHSVPSSSDRRLHLTSILNPSPHNIPPTCYHDNQDLPNSSTKQSEPDTTLVKPGPSKVKPDIPPLIQGPKERTKGGMSHIPNLLGPCRAEALKDITFRLTMRQQPQAARACGFGDRDRRVIDPPPIVQLSVGSPSMTMDEARSYLRYESYVMNCSIYDETGTRDASFMPEEYQHQRRLMGSLVGTPFVGQDEHGGEGCFFCFSDLSCRTPGAFVLKFTLIMIDPSRAGQVRHFPVLTEIKSDVFHVYSAKEFPGMLPSSSLAKRLREQGCIISIKKGNDRAKNTTAPDD
ncbi:hypothetical protein QQS21_012595 [Conoideocrella luteorostrata]|uniref:Velvet domain-containing protein n=1 Tax=Conoideocrella luteorostrata TaxID=1105319 RepID=A0AAJ0CD76_9HYPO|nr:hypothetical protein QQS21_012595 [Conoideocrella luteorostrata]